MNDGAAQAMEPSVGDVGAPEGSLLNGTTLERTYRIERLIAEGGMSAVYEGMQLRLNQRVAVKVMARELASNQEALARFRREAEITSRLKHPHLVTVMDFGTAPAGQPYLVMEYLEGIDLERRIREQGKLPLPTVVQLTRQVASALAAAHEQGIVHRDLKPANIFLVALPGEPDFAKVLDFGISKVRAAGTQLTKASAVIGTPNYMAPEQATGMIEEIDHRTDQWALACIVWEMLSGRATFASDDMSAVFYQVIHLDPQPLRNWAPEVPDAVEAVLRRGMSKKIADRFPSVRDFANELANAAGRRSSDSPSDLPGNRRRAGQERRRTASQVRTGDHTEAAAAAPLWRRVKPIHLVSALALGLLAAVALPLRGHPSAKAAALPGPVTAAIVKNAPLPSPPPMAAAPAETAPAVAEKAPAPAPTAIEPAGADAKAKTNVPDEAITPRRRTAKVHLARASRAAGDSDDPFASRPAGRRSASKARSADKDFVDPFGP